MKKIKNIYSLCAKILVVSGMALGIAGCREKTPPDLAFHPSKLEFGSKALGRAPTTVPDVRQLWELSNIHRSIIVLGGLTAEDLGLSAPFSVGTAGTCVAGTALAQNESCTLEIIFEPTDPGEFEAQVSVTYQRRGGDGEELGTPAESRGSIHGTGVLDCGYEADHPLCGEDEDLKYEPYPLQFGGVDLFSTKSLNVTVRNTDVDESVTLGAVDDLTLGLSESYTLDPIATTCTSGQILAANGGTCILVLTYRPQLNAYESVNLQLPFHEQYQDSVTEKAILLLQGTGVLNCSVTPELTAARQDGVGAAQLRNQQESAAGTAAGAALTYSDGHSAGYLETYQAAYNAAYSASYNTAYDSAYSTAYSLAYSSAYNNAYDQRYSQLVNDSTICSRGYSYGKSDGRSDGGADGQADGYTDGYNDFYPSGSTDGYYDGYDAGYAATCGSYSPPNQSSSPFSGELQAQIGVSIGALISPTDQQFPSACYQQGYNATYDSQSFARAYAAAKLANQEYQRGLRDGRAQGTLVGTSDGRAAGSTAGTREGASDGTVKGRSDGIATGTHDAEGDAQPVIDQIYSSCYQDGYYDGYLAAYDSSYASGYTSGSNDGYSDGYHSGVYSTGYSDGYSDHCGVASPELKQVIPSLRSASELRDSSQRYVTKRQHSSVPRWLTGVIGAEGVAELEKNRRTDIDGTDIHTRMHESMKSRVIRVR